MGFQPSMNAGVITGPEASLIVLDVDDPEEFEKLGLEVPVTFTVQTGKGFHYYFRMPAESGNIYRNRAKGSYDIRATMGYVVAPGSVHHSGKLYVVANNTRLADAPEWLLDVSRANAKAMEKIRAASAKRNSQNSQSDDLDLVEVDISQLRLPEKTKLLITEGHPAGSDRSKVDFSVIIELLKAGCSDAQVMWIFTEFPIGTASDERASKYSYLETTIDAAFERIADEIEQDSITGKEWRKRVIPEDEELDVAYRTLAEYATRDLVRLLNEHDNEVSPQRLRDLKMLIRTYSAMANRKIQGRIAFPLPTGYGKTTSIIAFLARASRMGMIGHNERHSCFSVAITAFKVDELCDLYEALLHYGVDESLISLCHSYKFREDKIGEAGYAKLPATYKVDPSTGLPMVDSTGKPIVDADRPILLLTHNKAKSADGTDFDSMVGKRTMLIWDESLLSTEAGAVDIIHIDTAIAHLESTARSMRCFTGDVDFLSGRMPQQEALSQTAGYLKACAEKVWLEIERQGNGLPKEVLSFDNDTSIPHGEMIDLLSAMIRKEQNMQTKELLAELRTFARITMHEASVELSENQKDHMIVRFDIVLPDSAENIVILDASTWINELMKLDRSIAIPEGIRPSLSYAGTKIFRINFNSGRQKVTSELQSNEHGLLDTIEEIVCKHPDESILFFTFKEKLGVDSQELIEDFLVGKGHDIHAFVNGVHPRFNWMTHGNYTASNRYSHCTVMIFVGLLHKPQSVYRAQAIAQTRDLTTSITRADEARLKVACHATDAHQGINRGAGRVITGDTTHPVTAYYTYLTDDLVNDLKTVMPDIEHKLYETSKLKVRTQVEMAVYAITAGLMELAAEERMISKRKFYAGIPELTQVNVKLRNRASEIVDADPEIPWRTDGRSWIRS